MFDNRTLISFISTLPVWCEHTYLPDANFCSTHDAQLPTNFHRTFAIGFRLCLGNTVIHLWWQTKCLDLNWINCCFMKTHWSRIHKTKWVLEPFALVSLSKITLRKDSIQALSLPMTILVPLFSCVQSGTLTSDTYYGCIESVSLFELLNTHTTMSIRFFICLSGDTKSYSRWMTIIPQDLNHLPSLSRHVWMQN